MNDFAKIENGLSILLSKDGYLLEKCISERAITHKLGEHLQSLFPEWNVDCEFNKNIDVRKLSDINPKELLSKMANYLEKKFLDNSEKKEKYDREELTDLINQLRRPEIEYDEGLGVCWFILKITEDDKRKKSIFPDIIIHHRGTHDNHIVIEAKKTNNRDNKNRLYDLAKLAILVSSSNYNYKKGIFIDLPVENDYTNFSSYKKIKVNYCSNLFKYLPIIKRP